MLDLIKSQNISKKSFTLFEVLLSLVLLGIALLSVFKLFVNNDQIAIYYQLQDIENSYNQTQTLQQTDTIKFQYHLDKIQTQQQ